MKIKSIIILLFLLIPAYALPITLEEAIKKGTQNSEAGRIVKYNKDSLKAEAKEVLSDVKPYIWSELSYYHFYEGTPSGGGSYYGGNQSGYGNGSDGSGSFYSKRQEDSASSSYSSPDRYISAQITASQLIFQGKKIWNSFDLEKTLKQYAVLTGITGARDIKRDIKNAFDKVFYQKAVVEILSDTVSQRKQELQDALDLKEVGMVTGLDVRQAELNLNVALGEEKEGQGLYRNALIDFNKVIGEDGSGNLLVPEGKLERAANLKSFIDVLKTTLKKGELIDLKLAKNSVNSARLEYKLAKDDYYPEVRLSARFDSSGEDFDDLKDDSYTVGLYINWDIFSGGSMRTNKVKTLSELNISKEKLKQLEKRLNATIETLYSDARSYNERIKLQTEAVSLAENNYMDAREHYRAGTITLTDLGQYNLDYAKARFALIELFYGERGLLIVAQALLD